MIKKFLVRIFIFLGLCSFSVFASDNYTYTHHTWTCVQDNGTNVKSSDTITSGKTYSTTVFNFNGEVYPIASAGCIGKETNTNYSISYNLNGADSLGGNVIYNSNGTFTLPTPTKANNDFLGWTGSNGSIVQKSVTVSAATTGNLSYTANWAYRPNVDVNMVINGTTYYSGNGNDFLFDVYLNGSLYRSGQQDFYERVTQGTVVKVVPTTNTYWYNVSSWEFTATGNQDYSGGPSWSIKRQYGYQDATGYGDWTTTSNYYAKTGTQYKVNWSKVSTTSVSRWINEYTNANVNYPFEGLYVTEVSFGNQCHTAQGTINTSLCSFNNDNHYGAARSCYPNTTWATSITVYSYGGAKGYEGYNKHGTGRCDGTSSGVYYQFNGITVKGYVNTTSSGTTDWQWNTSAPSGTSYVSHTSRTVYQPVTSWGSTQGINTWQQYSKSASRRLVYSDDGGATWIAY